MNKRICIMCGKEFDFWHSKAKTCGKKCSKEYGKRLKKLYKINNPDKVRASSKKYYVKNKKPTIKECKICEKKFIVKFGNCKTCSEKCKVKNINDNLRRNGKIYLKRHPDRRKETSHKYSIKNREKIKEKARIWRKNNPDKVNRQVNKWRKNNKKKRNAQAKAQRKIPFPKNKLCEICNKVKATDRHHENYDKPLEVKFLCPMCHSNEHHKKNLLRGVE